MPWVVLGAICSGIAFAQQNQGFNTTVPSSIMDQFRNQRANWTANVWVYANTLFGLLAVIEFAWSAAVMLLEKSDLQSWTSALIRKMMWLGAFYAVLLFGNSWIPAIIDSFTAIGQNASGVVALSPGDVFAQGLQIAGALLGGASASAFFTNPGPSLALVFRALLIAISYVIITINFIVTMVESYILVSVGFVFLGFGGSRWTAPYVERFIGLAVSIGIKILLLYCIIAAGMDLGLNWIAEAQSVSASARPLMTAFDVMGAAVIFMMLCWQIPKLFAGVLGGSPTLTGGDLAGTAAAIASGAIAIGSAVATSGATLLGRGLLASRALGAGAAGGGDSASAAVAGVGAAKVAGGGEVSPPNSPSAGAVGAGAARRVQPDPPPKVTASSAAAADAVGGQLLAGSGFEGERAAKGFQPATSVVSSSDALASQQQSLLEEAADATPIAADSGITSIQSGGSTAVPSVRTSRWIGVAATAQRVQRGLTRAAYHVYAMRRRITSDTAPPATPPRMPIDHHDE
jgi:type IV secretion system protein TrbL